MIGKNVIIRLLSVVLVITLLIILLCSCKSIAELTLDDKGKSFELEKGDRINIKLESNPTTGYEWILGGETDTSVVSLFDSKFVQTEKEEELVGAGGYEIFTFKAENSGQTEIILTYKRSWEEEELKEEFLFKINITVK
ncbi:MAG: proteinase inhibitor [Actinobacteria bacterium]|nr:MAG: proteinase inhibitor [Candidatus Atribacteria bacterium]TET14697.1 MAG: proteinase inhibitor [Actinomycetota bacterium]